MNTKREAHREFAVLSGRVLSFNDYGPKARDSLLRQPIHIMPSNIRSFACLCLTVLFLSTGCCAKTLRVFSVGNSFSANATEFLREIARDGGYDIDIRVAYKGGGSLKQHWEALEAALADAEDPDARIYKNGKSLLESLNGEKWDVITLQQYSKHSTDPSSYRPYIDKLYGYLKTNYPEAEIVIHQTWAYRRDSKDWGRLEEGGFSKNQREMFERSRGAYHRVATDLGLRVIPVGDAFWRIDSDPNWGFKNPAKVFGYPNLPDQTHSLHVGYWWERKNKFKLDSHHAGVAGKYLAALVWYGFLFDESPLEIAYAPQGVDNEFALVLRRAAAEALNELVVSDLIDGWRALPYPKSDTILGIEFDEETRRTEAPGSDIWPITWAEDGHQYTAFGDGGGFGGDNKKGRVSLGISRIEGDADNYIGKNVWGGVDAENPSQFGGKFTGLISIDGLLYAWLAGPDSKIVGKTKLAVSRDNSQTWELSDWEFTHKDGVYAGVFVNAGQDYADAPDDYVYSYFTRADPPAMGDRSWRHEVPGKIDLARAHRDRVLRKDAWEWFSGVGPDGVPSWSSDIADKVAAFEDPNGIKVVSVCYQPALDRYLLVYNQRDPHGNFALFEAEKPWGSWKEVAYLKGRSLFMPLEDTWRVGIYHFGPKWWSEDGSEFTLVFNVGDDAWNTVRGSLRLQYEN